LEVLCLMERLVMVEVFTPRHFYASISHLVVQGVVLQNWFATLIQRGLVDDQPCDLSV
jgi:hypothetical protein